MCGKKITIFSILFLFILSIGFVSASENMAGDVLEVDSDDALGEHIQVSGNTFDDIQEAFNNANENDVVELEGTYKSSDKQLDLQKSLTLQGSSKGATLDFDNSEYCLFICSDKNIIDDEGVDIGEPIPLNVIFKNLNFINSKGAIVSENSNLTIINCNFINNNHPLKEEGANSAISTNNYVFQDLFLKVFDSNFINCSGDLAGAILADNIVVNNSTFINNFAYSGGAISASNAVITKSKFSNNKANILVGLYMLGMVLYH